MRPVDLARAVALSPQAVRNYEEWGVLPPAARLPNGYRRYGPLHLAALRAFVALVGAAGHGPAREIMAAFQSGEPAHAWETLDAVHARALTERRTVRLLDAALDTADGRSARGPGSNADEQPLGSGELARRVGVTTTALRGWERAGILSPPRGRTGHRRYGRRDVRDAELAALLRRSGHGLTEIASVLAEIRLRGGVGRARQAVRERARTIDRDARALLSASAALSGYLALREERSGPADGTQPP
ncbi:MerR family transcriptional regulator [Streptomyces sp. XM4193]|uniref:MerR family transcriptional regulator n=1 Tax=Streptomyces sp. XM4193 TaxID=2929782 RepID=UPI001FFBDB0D|nr:MerR family transcriptional regulator [Streptomyces sp. XM4193]MCK1797242.1 MerR family transcriptional regulator [Streptomyces sp. XM4193]